ncbi:MAG: hypothetical protein HY924_06745 [Elusimicrobia bacterium]|nr:hypothetical protein [Elusimicrobiota bacterium]
MTKRALLAVFAAALALRLGLWLRMGAAGPQAHLRPDSLGYVGLARGLAETGRFASLGFDEPGIDAARTPGYPLFLALHRPISDSPRWPALTQCVLDSGAAVLLALAAGALAPGSPAWLAGLLYGLDPMTAAHAPLLVTEVPFNWLMILGLWLLLRKGVSPGPGWGLCLGAAALVRPIAAYLWPVWGFALLPWGRSSKARFGLGLFLAALIPGLWCARNLGVYGQASLSTVTGTNLLFYEAAAVRASAEGIPSSEAVRLFKAELALRYREPPATPFVESSQRKALAREYLLRHPGAVMRVHAAAGFKMLFGPGLDLLAEELFPTEPGVQAQVELHQVTGQGTRALLQRRPGLWLALAWTMALLAACYVLACRGAWRLLTDPDRSKTAAVLLPAAYLLVLSVGGWAYYRFRVPLWPFAALLAPLGWGHRTSPSPNP